MLVVSRQVSLWTPPSTTGRTTDEERPQIRQGSPVPESSPSVVKSELENLKVPVTLGCMKYEEDPVRSQKFH